MLYFFDTSALVKYYHFETGSRTVNEILESKESRVLVASLSLAEFVSAMTRIKNQGLVSGPQFEGSLERFTDDISSGRIGIVDVVRAHILDSYKLIMQYRLTTVDAIILTAALELREFDPIFVCADVRSRLLHAAESSHLSTLNPLNE